MPLWPVPPVIALLYYFLFLRPRSGRYWKVTGAVADPEPAAATGTSSGTAEA